MSFPDQRQRRIGARPDHWPVPSIYAIDTLAARRVRTCPQETAANISTSSRLPDHLLFSISLDQHFPRMDRATAAVTLADGDQPPKSVEQGDLSMRQGIERQGRRIE